MEVGGLTRPEALPAGVAPVARCAKSGVAQQARWHGPNPCGQEGKIGTHAAIQGQSQRPEPSQRKKISGYRGRT